MIKLIIIFYVILISGCAKPVKSITPYASPLSPKSVKSFAPNTGPFSAINRNFHQDYDRLVEATIQEIKGGSSPTIIGLGDEFILYSRGNRSQVQVIPPRFHQLKAVGHVALGVYVALSDYEADGVSPDEMTMIHQDRDLIQQAHDALDSGQGIIIQKKILQLSVTYLNKVLNEKHISTVGLQNYAKEVSPFLMQGAYLASKSQLDLVHENVNSWRGELSSEEWAKLKVVICSSHQPRSGELVSQYFRRILNEKATPGALGEDKIIYAESVFSEEKAINVLARHIIDQKAGQAFFNDRFRLQKDLLSDATSEYLDKLLP